MKFKKMTKKELVTANDSFDKYKMDLLSKYPYEKDIGAKDVMIEHLLQLTTTQQHYNEVLSLMDNQLALKPRAKQTHLKKYTAINSFGRVPYNVEDAVALWFKKYNVSINLVSKVTVDDDLFGLEQLSSNPSIQEKVIYKMAKEKVDVGALTKKLHLAIDQDSGLKVSGKLIDMAYSLLVTDQHLECQLAMYSNIEYLKSAGTGHNNGEMELVKFCEAIVDTDETHIKMAVYTIKSFIWQVKRKMTRQYVTNHLMPVFVGETGGGKSTAINKLLAPVIDATNPVNFKQINDDRNAEMFKSPVLFADEMSYLSNTDINHLKNRMTSDTIMHRPMYSNTITQLYNASTFIGTANKGLAVTIKDDTGLRRFAEINCLSKDKADWVAINAIDYDLIWKSVDEHDNINPMTVVKDMLEKMQEEERQKSPVEFWLQHFISSGTINFNTKYLAKDLFTDEVAPYMNSLFPDEKLDVKKLGTQLRELFKKTEYSKITSNISRAGPGRQYKFIKSECNILAAKYTGKEPVDQDNIIQIVTDLKGKRA